MVLRIEGRSFDLPYATEMIRGLHTRGIWGSSSVGQSQRKAVSDARHVGPRPESVIRVAGSSPAFSTN
jgi:hypothetical protein